MSLLQLLETYHYQTRVPEVVYHGSKTPRIKDFELRTGKRYVLFSEFEYKSNGFFFAVTPKDARGYGPHVSAYKITCKKPLVMGTEGVDKIHPNKVADFQYIFEALLDEDVEGDQYEHQGLVNVTYIQRHDFHHPEPTWFYHFIKPGGLDWECLDNPEFVRRMKERGYDSTVVYEPDTYVGYSWFVVSPEQIQFLHEVPEGQYHPEEEQYE